MSATSRACRARGLWRTTRHTDKRAALHHSRPPPTNQLNAWQAGWGSRRTRPTRTTCYGLVADILAMMSRGCYEKNGPVEVKLYVIGLVTFLLPIQPCLITAGCMVLSAGWQICMSIQQGELLVSIGLDRFQAMIVILNVQTKNKKLKYTSNRCSENKVREKRVSAKIKYVLNVQNKYTFQTMLTRHT